MPLQGQRRPHGDYGLQKLPRHATPHSCAHSSSSCALQLTSSHCSVACRVKTPSPHPSTPVQGPARRNLISPASALPRPTRPAPRQRPSFVGRASLRLCVEQCGGHGPRRVPEMGNLNRQRGEQGSLEDPAYGVHIALAVDRYRACSDFGVDIERTAQDCHC